MFGARGGRVDPYPAPPASLFFTAPSPPPRRGSPPAAGTPLPRRMAMRIRAARAQPGGAPGPAASARAAASSNIRAMRRASSGVSRM